MTDDAKAEYPIELAALIVLGCILPVAGYVWGPGETWQYVVWLAIGVGLVALYFVTHRDLWNAIQREHREEQQRKLDAMDETDS